MQTPAEPPLEQGFIEPRLTGCRDRIDRFGQERLGFVHEPASPFGEEIHGLADARGQDHRTSGEVSGAARPGRTAERITEQSPKH